MADNSEREEELAVKEIEASFTKCFEPLSASVLECWMAPDVTAFFAFISERIDGRDARTPTYKDFFFALRRNLPEEPDFRLVSERIVIQAASNVAVVTYQLRDSDAVGRRTLTPAKQDDGWRIIHPRVSEHQVTDCHPAVACIGYSTGTCD